MTPLIGLVLMFIALALALSYVLFGMHFPSRKRESGKGISLLVPFNSKEEIRIRTWEWLKEYWKHELPGVQIVIGHDHAEDLPFSKTTAVNDAAQRADGDIFVILDSDGYLPGSVIHHCAEEIREARKNDFPLWFVPYRNFFRLNQETSTKVLESSPEDPLRPLCPPPPEQIDRIEVKSSHGHWYGALIQIMPREAFELVGGMDPRFRNWGSEDISFMRAVDCLYGKHKTTKNCVFHLWHPRIGFTYLTRTWGEKYPPRRNELLGNRYRLAVGDRQRMADLVAEGFADSVREEEEHERGI